MDFQAKQAPHRRMIKLPLKARSPIDVLQPRQYDTSATVVTQTVAQTAAASSTSAPVVSGLPTSTAALAGVAVFLSLIVISVAACCFYRRRKLRRNHTKKAPSASFNRDAFVEKKNPFMTGLDPPVLKVDLPLNTRTRPPPLPLTPSSASSTEETGKSQSSGAMRVTNNPDRLTAMPALPKAVAEKRRPSQRVKSSWMSPSAEEFIGSPPPSYDMANGSPGFLIPIPPQLPPQKARASPTPPTPPATRVSHNIGKSSKKGANLQALVVPKHDVEPAPVPSPARSESFAHKDIVIPSPAPVLSAAPSSSMPSSSSESTPKAFGSGARMMTVIAPYTPTLADELHVSVGDTVRLLQEYQDGWGFVQYVGKGDAPKGVVPLVCLQERRRMVPAMPHKTSNGSVSSFTTNWR